MSNIKVEIVHKKRRAFVTLTRGDGGGGGFARSVAAYNGLHPDDNEYGYGADRVGWYLDMSMCEPYYGVRHDTKRGVLKTAVSHLLDLMDKEDER